MLEMVMVKWLVDMFLKTVTLIHNVMIQVTLRIFLGMLKSMILVVDMFLWTSILNYSRMVTTFSRDWLHYYELILEGEVESSDDDS